MNLQLNIKMLNYNLSLFIGNECLTSLE